MEHNQSQYTIEALNLDTKDAPLSSDDGWMKNLWKWADKNGIDDHCIPRNKQELLELEKLDLGHKKMFHMPKEIGNLRNLKELNLSYNYLIELPREIGRLANLSKLYLGKNKLVSLPREIGNLINLQKLDLSNNRLTKLPKEIGNLVNLTLLYLYHNQLVELPKEIVNMNSLDLLGIGGNKSLKFIPKEVLKHTQIDGYKSNILKFQQGVMFIVGVAVFVVLLPSFLFAFLSGLYHTGGVHEIHFIMSATIAFSHITGSMALLTLLFYFSLISTGEMLHQQRLDTDSATSVDDLKDALKEYSNKHFINRFADFLGFFPLFSLAIFVVTLLLHIALIWYTGVYDLDYAPFAWLLNLVQAIVLIVGIILGRACYVITGNQLGEPRNMRKFLEKEITYIEAENS